MEHETIEIAYSTDSGHGHMTLNAEYFFPCQQGILKKLLKTVALDWQHEEEIIKQIEDHCTRGIQEAEEYKKLIPKFYEETREKIPELEQRVRTREQAVKNLQVHYKLARGQERKQLSETLKKAKEDLKQSRSVLRNTEAKCKEYIMKMDNTIRMIQKYKDNLELLKQRK